MIPTVLQLAHLTFWVEGRYSWERLSSKMCCKQSATGIWLWSKNGRLFSGT